MPPRLSVFVAAYNEEENVEAAIDELAGYLQGLGLTWELVIVDDGSTDATARLAEHKAQDLPHTRVLRHPRNLGLGGFYRSGISQAQGDYLTFFPADGQFPATIIGQYLPHMERADLVVGYIGERNDSPFRKLLSGVERLLYQAMFGPLPRFQGIIMVRRLRIPELGLVASGRGWGVVFELIVKAVWQKWTIVNVSTPLRPRWAGQSKVLNFRTVWANLREVFQLWRQLRFR